MGAHRPMGLAKVPVRAASTGKPCFSIYPAMAELQRPHHKTTGNLWGRLSPHDGSEGGWAPVALWDPHFAPTDSRFLRWGCRGHPYSGLVSYRHGALGGPPPSTGIGTLVGCSPADLWAWLARTAMPLATCSTHTSGITEEGSLGPAVSAAPPLHTAGFSWPGGCR